MKLIRSTLSVSRNAIAIALLPFIVVQLSFAWGVDGHHIPSGLDVDESACQILIE